ncbi:hypothetical protein NIES3974_35880 [Calothrix sp. NIES-3974]|nr:hypothetical protein NIES3974_35880 [Calothrix sp. NIES-3974]
MAQTKNLCVRFLKYGNKPRLAPYSCFFEHNPKSTLLNRMAVNPYQHTKAHAIPQTPSQVNKKRSSNWSLWRLTIPLGLQTGLLLLLTTPHLYIQLVGNPITLHTDPIDPYDWLQAHSLSLNLPISRVETLHKLPGWQELTRQYPGSDPKYYPLREGTRIYLTLQKSPTPGSNTSNRPWKPIAISSNYPERLAPHQIALKGYYQHGIINYGMENYPIPTVLRRQAQLESPLSHNMRASQSQPILITIKVDPQGNAIPMEMKIGDRIYKF